MWVLDSNILIYASQPGYQFLDSWLAAEGATMSAISIPEVLGFTGLSTEDEALFETMFARLRIAEVSDHILQCAAGLRRLRRMKLGDAIVAATAVVHKLPLVTRNVHDFRHIAGLDLKNPFDPA